VHARPSQSPLQAPQRPSGSTRTMAHRPTPSSKQQRHHHFQPQPQQTYQSRTSMIISLPPPIWFWSCVFFLSVLYSFTYWTYLFLRFFGLIFSGTSSVHQQFFVPGHKQTPFVYLVPVPLFNFPIWVPYSSLTSMLYQKIYSILYVANPKFQHKTHQRPIATFSIKPTGSTYPIHQPSILPQQLSNLTQSQIISRTLHKPLIRWSEPESLSCPCRRFHIRRLGSVPNRRS
jgi:hypothetical protein